MNKFKSLYLFSIPLLVVVFSYIQGAHNLDPHHWGLMLSNAKDLSEGALPYKNIFIQYGIFTTLIQTLAFGIGGNMLSIILVTSLFYAAGLIIVYRIGLHIFKNQALAIYTLTLIFLFHPLAIYPWSNYIAFPFLMLGIYFLIHSEESSGKKNNYDLYLCGVSFSFAILSREGLLYPVVIFILSAFVIDCYPFKDVKKYFFRYLKIILGIAVPISIFFLYLLSNDLLEYWVAFSIKLPALYASESFGFLKNFIFEALFQEIYKGYRYLDIRWILASLIIFSCLWAIFSRFFARSTNDLFFSIRTLKIALIIFMMLAIATQLSESLKLTSRDQAWLPFVFIVFLCLLGFTFSLLVSGNQQKKGLNPSFIKIAVAALLLLSSSLHLSEIFRIATGSIVGVIVLLAYLDNKGIAKPTFIFLVAWLFLTAIYGNRGNYFLPSIDALALSEVVTDPPILRGQRWSKDAAIYYKNVKETLEKLQHSSCGAKHIINETQDAIITAVSPLKALQTAPFAVNPSVRKLRPDDDILLQKTPQDEIILLQSVPRSVDYSAIKSSEHKQLVAHYLIPKQAFLPDNQRLLIFASEDCAQSYKK
jgi:hypothetical protein